ncbi:MAG: AAC(3) family N-acetyltransferase [Chloroflexi bacterium]|nr:AAC(3) family N-acetyltransferase [Chloroflexota bacterium]
MLTFNDLIVAFETLGLQNKPVIAHASLHSFGRVEGGADSVITSLMYTTGAFIMPTHTYKTMVTPASGPANNAVNYTRGQQWNRLSEPYRPDMPADRMMGVIPDSIRHWPEAARSMHPILSFSGIRADKILKSQTIEEPFAPLRALVEQDGWVMLIGVDHTVNTSIHFAEKLAGRKQFVRWALTESGTVTCPGFPGCSAGFQVIEPEVRSFTKSVKVGEATVLALPLRALMIRVIELIKKDRYALLCDRSDCERCGEVRKM